jgi:hypothetical protein
MRWATAAIRMLPFNPTYSLPSLPVSKTLDPTGCSCSCHRHVPGGVQSDLMTPTLISCRSEYNRSWGPIQLSQPDPSVPIDITKSSASTGTNSLR